MCIKLLKPVWVHTVNKVCNLSPHNSDDVIELHLLLFFFEKTNQKPKGRKAFLTFWLYDYPSTSRENFKLFKFQAYFHETVTSPLCRRSTVALTARQQLLTATHINVSFLSTRMYTSCSSPWHVERTAKQPFMTEECAAIISLQAW